MKFTLFLSLLLVVLTIRRNYRTKQVEPTPPQTVQAPINDSTAEKVGETIANRYWEIFKTIDVNKTMKLILQKLQNCTMNMDGQNQKKQWMIKIN